MLLQICNERKPKIFSFLLSILFGHLLTFYYWRDLIVLYQKIFHWEIENMQTLLWKWGWEAHFATIWFRVHTRCTILKARVLFYSSRSTNVSWVNVVDGNYGTLSYMCECLCSCLPSLVCLQPQQRKLLEYVAGLKGSTGDDCSSKTLQGCASAWPQDND